MSLVDRCDHCCELMPRCACPDSAIERARVEHDENERERQTRSRPERKAA